MKVPFSHRTGNGRCGSSLFLWPWTGPKDAQDEGHDLLLKSREWIYWCNIDWFGLVFDIYLYLLIWKDVKVSMFNICVSSSMWWPKMFQMCHLGCEVVIGSTCQQRARRCAAALSYFLGDRSVLSCCPPPPVGPLLFMEFIKVLQHKAWTNF